MTDTCIPEEAIQILGELLLPRWMQAASRNERAFPHEYLCRVVLDPFVRSRLPTDTCHSWVIAAAEQSVPIFVPGWEDSTLGNLYTARVIDGTIPLDTVIRSGSEYLAKLVAWYRSRARLGGVGMLQLGGGIAGDFAASIVPLIRQDVALDVPMWSYFCQVSNSTTSYGSYSGAVPNEKITWGKISVDTPRFMIESDATIVAPLIFASVMDY